MQRGLVIFVLAAGVLSAGAAILLLRTPQAATSPTPTPTNALRTLDVGTVDRMSIAWPDASTIEIRKHSQIPSLWLLHQGDHSWPVGASRIRGAVRLLIDAAQGPAQESIPIPNAITLRLGVGSGEHTLRIAATGLAGQSVLESIEGDASTTYLVKGGLAKIFEQPGVLAWREDAAFLPIEGSGASRIVLEDAQRSTSFARVGGHWSIVEPSPGPCDAEAMTALVGSLGAIRLRPSTEVNNISLGFEKPVARLMLGQEFIVGLIDGDVARRRLEQTLIVGDIADPEGKTRYAQLVATLRDPMTYEVTPAWNPTPWIIDASSLASIAIDPDRYWFTRSTTVAPADVRGIRISLQRRDSGDPATDAARSVQYSRTLDGWDVTVGTITRPASPADRASLGILLTLLADSPAKSVIHAPDNDINPLAVIELLAELDQPMDTVLFMPSATGTLTLRNASHLRLYEGEKALAVAEFLSGL